jgi:hypothetical protein
MLCFRVLFFSGCIAAFWSAAAAAQGALGPQGAVGEPDRAQSWLVPSPDPGTPAHAILFRPPVEARFRLALIARASTQNVLRRATMAQPAYRPPASFLIARGLMPTS